MKTVRLEILIGAGFIETSAAVNAMKKGDFDLVLADDFVGEAEVLGGWRATLYCIDDEINTLLDSDDQFTPVTSELDGVTKYEHTGDQADCLDRLEGEWSERNRIKIHVVGDDD